MGLGREIIPPGNKWSNGTSSFTATSFQYHHLQTEIFYIESSADLWYLCGQVHRLKAGDAITNPRCEGHRFDNFPHRSERLEILYGVTSRNFIPKIAIIIVSHCILCHGEHGRQLGPRSV